MKDQPTSEQVEGALAIVKCSRAICEAVPGTPPDVIRFLDALLFRSGKAEFIELVRKGLLLTNDNTLLPKGGEA